MICDHLDWLKWAWVPFGLLTIIFWLIRGPGPRAPLLFLLLAGVMTGFFGLSIWAISAYALSASPAWLDFLNQAQWILSLCMLGAPVAVGIAFGMAKGARLFVVAASFTMLFALLGFTELGPPMIGSYLSCPQFDD